MSLLFFYLPIPPCFDNCLDVVVVHITSSVMASVVVVVKLVDIVVVVVVVLVVVVGLGTAAQL